MRTLSTPGAAWRWVVPWLLAGLAVAELVAQYALVAAARVWSADTVPRWLDDLLRSAAGIDAGLSGAALWLALLRPVAVLAAIRVYRSFFALGGALASSHSAHREPLGSLERQAGLAWLCRRWLVLHAGKLLLVAAFCASMQLPSAVGLALVIAVAGLAPTRSHAATAAARGAAPPAPVRASDASAVPVVLLQWLSSLWLLICYSLQVPAIQDALLTQGGSLAPWVLAWAGVPVVGPDPLSGELPLPGGGRGLEVLLRWKALLLAAAALWQRARRWEQRLPAEVLAAAQPGDACPLFWPLPGSQGAAAARSGPLAESAGRLAAQLKRTLLKVRSVLHGGGSCSVWGGLLLGMPPACVHAESMHRIIP